MIKVFLFLFSFSCFADSFSLHFFDDRIAPAHREKFQSFFTEIEEDIPVLFKNNIRYPIQIEFATFDNNKIKLNCKMREFENYARLIKNGVIQVNEKLLIPILNRHMDRIEDNDCTYREALSEGITKALMGHLFKKFTTDIKTFSESA